ncbi:HAD superfamily hydrolase (TIGR01509 family) [Microbacterium sp. W4I4]|uniref:HAD family hydrolase n=1 Tax=Microbacterium sp. W4I4 TaxID=3042295 RepID=UPI002783A109|nr:HAD family phosphatase [Microbacterium sp. W4I4]MDQ0613360.1 HAD superfamily hydrolase (TIGR01509 family) [Microbacterium sp. W4I4]
MISTVLFDLDGVIRHFEPEVTAAIERRHGIAPGLIAQIAFTSSSVEQLTTGRLLRADWITAIGAELGNHEAAREWGAQRARVDPEMLVLAGELTAAGIRTSILTNGTDTIPAETADLGLNEHFDPIFNTAEIGFAKPDARAFTHVLDALGCEPASVLFADDTQANVAGAAELGIRTHHFRDAPSLRVDLKTRGVLAGA